MPAITKGQTCLFGIGATYYLGFVQSVSIKSNFANEDEVVDEEGNVVTRHYDDRRKEITLEVVPKTGAAPTIGQDLSFLGTTYIIESVDDKREAKGFVKYTITARNYEKIAGGGS